MPGTYGTILALDLATTTGWAIGRPGQKLRSGSQRFAARNEDQATGFARYSLWLADILATEDVTEVCYEQPMDPRHMMKNGRATTNFDTIRLLLGLCAITEAEARKARVKTITEAPVQSVRSYLLRTRPPKGEAKAQVMRMLNILGYRPGDDNEADALAIFLYASGIRAPGVDVSTPLPLRGRG